MWTPKEVRRLIAQTAGIVFGIGAIALMMSDVRATGKINISSNFVSGQIESGSAGLLLLFFAFFLIIIPSIHFGVNQPRGLIVEDQSIAERKKKSLTTLQKALLVILIGSILTIVLFITGQQNSTTYPALGNFLVFGAYVIGVISGVVIVVTLISPLTGEFDEVPKKPASKE